MNFKTLYENFWVFQAFQIPIVLFIIILLTSAARRINRADLAPIGEIFDPLQTAYLQWIGWGFCIHLLYLSVHLNSHLLIVRLSFKLTKVLEISFDILSTFIFVQSSLHWYFSRQMRKVVPDKDELRKSRRIYKLLVATFILATGYVLIKNYFLIARMEEYRPAQFSLSSAAYDLISYLTTAGMLASCIDMPYGNERYFTGRNFILGGFALWSLIQLWKPIAYIADIRENKRDLVGFGASTFAKMSIFYGLLSNYIGMARTAIQRKSETLVGNTRKLSVLQEYITDMSRASSFEEIPPLLQRHLIWADLFQFDQVKFFRVDHLKQKIVQISAVDKGAARVVEESTAEEYSFDHQGFEMETVRSRKRVTTDGNTVNGKRAGLKENGTLSERYRYLQAEKEGRVHLFIPAINHGNHKNSYTQDLAHKEQRIVGVFDASYYKDNKRFNGQVGNTAELLEIYIDNFAQTFYRLSESQVHTDILGMLEDCDNKSGDNEISYLKYLLEHTCRFIHADAGIVRLLSFNQARYKDERPVVAYERPDEPAGRLPFHGCPDTMVEAAFDTHNLVYKNRKDKESLSMAIVPIRYDNRIIGCLEVWSNKAQFFNEQSAYVLWRIVKDAGRFFISKKFHNAASTLTHDNADLFQMEAILQPAVRSIQQYFMADHVSIWSQTNTAEPPVCVKSIQPGISGWASGYLDLDLSAPRKKVPDYAPIDLNTEEPNEVNKPFWQFAKDNGMQTLVLFPLMIEKQQYGFFNLYSKRQVTALFSEDVQLLRLIANKCVVSLVVSDMVKSFSKVTESLVSKEPHEVLVDITRIAGKILHSDPVVLFLLDNEHNIKYNSTIFSGYVSEPDKLKEGRKANFLEATLKIGVEKFYPTESDLPKGFDVSKSFFKREKIRSVAAMPLKHEDQFIGVMYFNYRREHNFTELVKQMIRTFSSLATSAIINTDHVAQVGDKYSKILDTLEKIVPASNSASLADIVRAVNHDIRHSLTSVSQNLIDIRDNLMDRKINDQNKNNLLSNIAIIENNINNSTDLIELFDPKSFGIAYIDLYSIARDVVLMFVGRNKRNVIGINVVVKRPKDALPTIRCVRAELSMVIYNLITNSRNALVAKWNKEGRKEPGPSGNITVRVGYNDSDKINWLEVEDNGCGIDNKTQERIFEPGYSTTKGLGIGLFFVQETIVKSYLGTITCESTVDRGTTFKLKFKQHVN